MVELNDKMQINIAELAKRINTTRNNPQNKQKALNLKEIYYRKFSIMSPNFY